MNILVTGAHGQLGEEIRRAVEKIGNGKPNHYVGEPNYYIFTGHKNLDYTKRLDITNEEEVTEFVKKNSINVIVNCAAYTDVDKAQTDREVAYNVNALGPMYLALAAKEVGAVLIHISTDYVFGGKYDSPLPPISQMNQNFVPVEGEKCYYGYSKMIGEDLIEHSGCKYIIIRTSWVYSSHHRNFAKTMHAFSTTNRPAKVVNDQTGSPTSAKDLADFIVHIIEDNNADTRYLSKQGIYNFANVGETTWYDLARCVFTRKELVTPCSSEEFPTPVERPRYSVLDTTLTEKTFDYEIPKWRASLLIVLNELNEIERRNRLMLELENTEYSFGHNVCTKEKEEEL